MDWVQYHSAPLEDWRRGMVVPLLCLLPLLLTSYVLLLLMILLLVMASTAGLTMCCLAYRAQPSNLKPEGGEKSKQNLPLMFCMQLLGSCSYSEIATLHAATQMLQGG